MFTGVFGESVCEEFTWKQVFSVSERLGFLAGRVLRERMGFALVVIFKEKLGKRM